MEFTNTQTELNKYGVAKEDLSLDKNSDSKNISISEWNTLINKLEVVLADVRRLYSTLYSELPKDLNVAEDAISERITTGDAATLANAEKYAKDYADGLAGNYDAAGSAAVAKKDANDYTDSKISELSSKDTAIEGNVTTLQNIVEGYTAENPIKTAVDSLAQEVAKKAAQDALTALTNRVNAFLDNTGAATEAIDTLQELITYIDTHDDVDIGGILADIQALENKLDLTTYIDGEEPKEYATVKAYVEAVIEALRDALTRNIEDKFEDMSKFLGDYDSLDKTLDTLEEIQKRLNSDGFTTAGIVATSDNRTVTAKNHTKDTFEAFRISISPVSSESGKYYNTIVVTDSAGYMRTETISDGLLKLRYLSGVTNRDKYLVNLRTLDNVLDTFKLGPHIKRLDDLTTRVESLELNHVQYNSVDFESVAKLPGNMMPVSAPILFLNRLGGKLSTKYSPYTNNNFKIVDVSGTDCTISSSGSLVFEDHGYHDTTIDVILPTPGYKYRLLWFGDATAVYSFGTDPFAETHEYTPYEEYETVKISFTEFYGLDAKFAIYREDCSTEVFEPCTTFVRNIPSRVLTYTKDGTETIDDKDLPSFYDLTDFGMDVGDYKSYIDLDEKKYYRVAYSGVLNDSADELWRDEGVYDSFRVFRWCNNQSVEHIECNYYRVKPVAAAYRQSVDENGKPKVDELGNAVREKIPLLEHAVAERTNCILYEPGNSKENFYVVTNEFASLDSFKDFLKSMEAGNTPVEFIIYREHAQVSNISDMLDTALGDWNQYKDIFPMKCAQEGTLALSAKVNSVDTDNVCGTYTYLTTKEL